MIERPLETIIDAVIAQFERMIVLVKNIYPQDRLSVSHVVKNIIDEERFYMIDETDTNRLVLLKFMVSGNFYENILHPDTYKYIIDTDWPTTTIDDMDINWYNMGIIDPVCRFRGDMMDFIMMMNTWIFIVTYQDIMLQKLVTHHYHDITKYINMSEEDIDKSMKEMMQSIYKENKNLLEVSFISASKYLFIPAFNRGLEQILIGYLYYFNNDNTMRSAFHLRDVDTTFPKSVVGPPKNI